MAVQANPDFSALNTSTRLLQKGSAPVSLPMLSHLALRGSTTNAIFSPQFNARHVSLGNILSGSGGRPSMKDTVYASANDKQFLGFDATDMGIVVYSLHEFAESPDSYHDLLSKCRQVGGAPLVSLSKVSAPDENGEQDHFTLYCDTCCAVPVTIDAVNTLRRVLGCGHMVTEGPVTLSDIQGLFASMSKLDLTTVSAYRTFCEERRIPFPIPDQHTVTIGPQHMPRFAGRLPSSCKNMSICLLLVLKVTTDCTHRLYSARAGFRLCQFHTSRLIMTTIICLSPLIAASMLMLWHALLSRLRNQATTHRLGSTS